MPEIFNRPFIQALIVAASTAIALCVLGFLLTVLLKSRFSNFLFKNKFRWHQTLAQDLNKFLIPASIIIGLLSSLRFWNLKDNIYVLVKNLLFSSLFVVVTIFLIKLTSDIIRDFEIKHQRRIAAGKLIRNIATIIIICLGILMVLRQFDIPIAPMLAALGVGGIAVALALQETLSNLFAGIYISLAGKLNAGDYIKLDSGEEGYIEDISWRETSLRMSQNDLVAIPNGRLAKANITYFNLPDTDSNVWIEFKVDIKSDLEKVENIVLDVAKEVQKDLDDVNDFVPRVRFRDFGDSTITVSAVLRSTAFDKRVILRHEFIKHLQARLLKEGIISSK